MTYGNDPQNFDDGTIRDERPSSPTEWYYFRQGQKSVKAELRDTVAEQLKATMIDPAEHAKVARENRRLQAIIDAGLTAEVAKLVPADLEDPAAYISETLKPVMAKFEAPTTFGGVNRPDRSQGQNREEALLSRFRELQSVDPKEAQSFFDKYHEILTPLMSRQG